MTGNSKKTAQQILSEILLRKLQVSPELKEKRRHLLQILAEESKSEPLDDSNDSKNGDSENRPAQ